MRKISIIILAVVLALFAITACNDSVGDLFGFELTFNANGGTGTMANVSVKGSSTTAPANKFTRDGYTFVSWNTEADGSGTEYKVGAKIEGASTLSVRLYAQWSANTYSITVGPKASAEVSSYTISDSIQNIALTLSPAAGDDFVSWTVTGNATVSGNTLTIPAGAYGDITVVPTFKAQVYAVSFNRNGGIINAGEISTYTYGTGATLPSDLTKTGFTFGGWYDNEECKGTAVAAITTTDLGDKTFYAKWNVNDYTVTLNANGGTIIEGDVTSYTYGVGATLPANVTKEGCTFAGWFDNEGCTGDAVVSISVAETGSKVFYAKWTANTYAVTFVKNGGTINEGAITGYTYGEVTALPTNVTKSGHTFAGWFTDEKYTGSAVYTIAADETGAKTFYAKWIATGYSITCIPTEYGFAYGLYEEYTVNDGDIYIQLTAVPHSGYALYGYEVTGGAYTDVNDEYLVIPAGTTGDITVTPLFDKVVYFITVNKSVRGTASAEAISYVISDTDTEVALDATPDTGFALFDWSLEADEAVYVKDNILVIPAGIVGDVYVTPNFLPIFNVTLNKNGGTVDEGYDVTEYFFAEETVLPTAEHFKRTGNVFGGWFDNDQYEGNPVTVITRGTSGDKTFYAKWTPNKFKVEFDKNATSATGTMAVQNFTYDVAQNLTALGYSRTGYTFAGWNTVATPTEQEPGTSYADKASVSNLTDVDGATVTLYAQWTANTYTVKFNANGGSGTMADQSFTYDVTQALTEKAFTRTGHTFANWNSVATPTQQTPGVSYADKAEVSNLTAVKDGVYNLYAQWTANTYTVTLNANGGTIAQGKNVTSYTYGVGATLPTAADITKTGYTFGGWYDNEQCTGTAVTTISTTDLGNKTFYAKWTAVTYTVKFDKNSDDATGAMTDMTFTYDVTQALTANSFKRIGNTFTGWNTVATPTEQEPGTAYVNKEEVKNLKSTQDAEVTLYAQWELTEYSVKITSGSEGYTVTPSADKYYYTLDQSGTVITLDIEGPIPTIDHYSNLSPATANVDVGSANNTVTIKSGSYGNIEITCYFITDYKTVTFKANGGTGDDVTQYVGTDIETALKANTFTRDTMYFAGWSTTAEGEVEYEDGAMITVTEDTTLYAVWTDEAPFEYITTETTTLTGGKVYTIAYEMVGVVERLSIDGTDPVTIILPQNKDLVLDNGISVFEKQTLNIQGEGNLSAFGNDLNAGIGGRGDDQDASTNACGTVNISGGNVYAVGGTSAAGIGGGNFGDGGVVTISGGNVTVYAGSGAAGIGGGMFGNGGNFNIVGGVFYAEGSESDFVMPAVGAGFTGSNDGTIYVEGVELKVSDNGWAFTPYNGEPKRYMAVFDTSQAN